MKRPSPTEMVLANLAAGRKEISAKQLKVEYHRVSRKPLCDGTFYTAMRRLEQTKYVRRKVSKESGRETVYLITAKGVQQLDRYFHKP